MNEINILKSLSKQWRYLLCCSIFFTFGSVADVLQSSTITLVDSQYNNTNRAANNLLDADESTYWLSSKPVNDINFSFANNGGTQCLTGFNLTNYGTDSTSVRQFALLATTNGSLEADKGSAGWRPIVANNNPTHKIDYLNWAQGAKLISVDSQHDNRTWSANHLNDGSPSSTWLSNKENNVFEYEFDSNWDGTAGDAIPISEIETINYGNNDRSVRELQVEVTSDNLIWKRLEVPGSVAGDSDFNFNLLRNGGTIGAIDSQHNSTNWAASNLQDGDASRSWLSRKSNNTIEFTFDPNNNTITGANGDAEDLFTLSEIRLENYGQNDRSVKEFQIEIQTLSKPQWHKLTPLSSAIGQPNYNFAMYQQGARLVQIDSQHNATNWAAKNIHDGDSNSTWLSSKGNNTLAFQFDADGDGVLAGVNDRFSFNSFFLRNYGNNDRSINAFQVAIKTASNTNWHKLKVPDSTSGVADYNFAMAQQGGLLDASSASEVNSSYYAAANLNDADLSREWLGYSYRDNIFNFQFDADQDGIVGGLNDLFTLESFHLVNYGVNDRSIKLFQVEVKTSSNPNWSKLPVSGSQAGEPNYPYSLAANGGSLSSVDSQLNSQYAAQNLIDGNHHRGWLSNKQNNTLAFAFDTDNNGSSGDPIKLNKITLINYDTNDVSIQTFEIDIQVSGGAWQSINAPSGGTIFTAALDSNEQSWSIGAYNNVTATRIRTLSNYGDGSYTGAKELIFSGDSISPNYTFQAAMHKEGETFVIDAANQPQNVTDVRLHVINNYGDSSYVGAKEFKLLGSSLGPSYTFYASMHGNGETFTLNTQDVPVDVTDVKLITINNHGDPSYIGAKEFKLLGPSVTKSKTFVADMHGDVQTIALSGDDDLEQITAVKLITISNYGDPSYTAMQEFALIGKSLHPSNTFIIPATKTPHKIVLDPEDSVTDIIGVRVYTLGNYGDKSYTGLSELKLLGDPVTPSYIFNAEKISGIQNFELEPTLAEVFRFHSMNNHDNYYTRARDFSVTTGECKTAQWRMNEASWQGVPNEVLDATGSGYNGVAIGFAEGEAPNTKFVTPVTSNDPGTCRYGEFDGVDDYILINNGELLDDISALTVSAWIKPARFSKPVKGEQRGVFSQGATSSKEPTYSAFFIGSKAPDEDQSRPLYIDIVGDDDRFASNTLFDIDTWYHIAFVFDGNKPAAQRVKLYVNGVLDGTFYESTSHIPDTTGEFYIGNLHFDKSAKSVFEGAIDELIVRPIAAGASEVAYLMNQSAACSEPLHHIEIEHDGSGLTCASETISLKACADAQCANLFSSDVEVTLSATGTSATWSQNPVTIPAGSSIDVELTNTSAQTISLSAMPSNHSPSSALACEPNCDITFFNSGYLLNLDNHAACSTATLSIQALQLSDTSTSCAGAYSGGKSVDLTFNYANPTTGTKLPLLDGSIMAAAGSAQTRTITFDENATAQLDFVYEDAGQISIEVSDSDNAGLSATSITSVVLPAKLIVDSPDLNAQCPLADASCSAFIPAGAPFNLNITAACLDNTVTPNFVMSDIPLTINTLAPVLGHPVELAHTSISFAPDDQGVHHIGDQTISEVGVFTISATPATNAYFNETVPSTTSESLGRFTPAYFDLEVNEDGILSSGNSFVYSGQMASNTSNSGALAYVLASEFNIIPKSETGRTTLNYYDDFAKLKVADVERVTPVEDTTQLGADGLNKVGLSATLNTASITQSVGELRYTYDSDDNFVYTRNANALVAPFTSKIALTITSITDSDNIAARDLDNDSDNGVLSLMPYSQEVRFGRLFMDNSFGPETDPVEVAMTAQYWQGTNFVSNTVDNSSTFTLPDDLTITDISLAPATTSSITSGLQNFTAGQASFMLASPGEGNQGRVSIIIQAPPWLQYDWSTQSASAPGSFSDNPSATINFGIYRGDDRTIHWREVFQ